MASRFWVGGTGSWDQATTTHWSASTGGAGGASVPTAADDVIFDANSGLGTCTITASAPCRSLQSNTGGSLSTLKTLQINASVTLTLGTSTSNGTLSLDLTGFTTLTLGSNTTSALSFVSTSGTQERITCHGLQLGNVTFNGAAGSWLLVDGFSTGLAATVTLTAGTLNLGGQTCSWGVLSSGGSSTRALDLTNANVTILAAGISWTVTSTGMTLTPTGSTITMSDTSASSKTFAGGGVTYGALTLTAGGTGAVRLASANTFTTITVGAPKTLTFPISVTTTCSAFVATGSAGNLITLNSATGGTAATLSCSSQVSCDWLSIQDVHGAGNIPFYAGANSTLVSGDTNWNLTGPPIAPVVATQAATALTATSATVNGTVNPEGQASTYHFDWGTSVAYTGGPTGSLSAGSGSSPVAESANLTGLAPGTTYHYRIVATNATGTTNGTDGTFTTSAAAAAGNFLGLL